MISLTELDSPEALRALTEEWDALMTRAFRTTVFQSPAWILSGLAHLPSQELVVLAFREGRDLVGLAPLFRWQNGPRRTLSLLLPGLSDHLDVVAAEGCEDAIAGELAQWLSHRHEAWDACQFDDIGPEAVLRRLPDVPGARATWTPHGVCPALSLDTGIPPAQARKLARDRSRAARAGRLDFHRADASRDSASEAMECLFALHARRWKTRGQAGVLAKDDIRGFHLAAAEAFRARGALRLYVQRIGGRVAAVVFGFRAGACLSLVHQGIEPELERTSPGTLLLGGVLDDAHGEGVRVVDFLRGDEAYKFAWGAVAIAAQRLRLDGPVTKSTGRDRGHMLPE